VILVIAPPVTAGSLLAELQALQLPILRANDCRQARAVFRYRSDVDVVVVPVSLPDGNWSDVHRSLVDTGLRASLVVLASEADPGLWSEVIWRGGYDLLVEPYAPSEVHHCIEGALREARRLRELSSTLALAAEY
jgi:AmiR/NasT family two-component response regulator